MYGFNLRGVCGAALSRVDWEAMSAELMRRYGETGTTPAQISRELWPTLAMSTVHSRLRHIASLGLPIPNRPKPLREARYGRCRCGSPYIKARSDGAVYCPECGGTPPPPQQVGQIEIAVRRWYPDGVRNL